MIPPRPFFLLAALAIVAPAAAQDCPLPPRDLADRLMALPGSPAVLATERVDPQSAEPIRSYVVDDRTGRLVVLEQKDCMMRNLTVTLLSPHPVPDTEDLEAMAAALNTTPVWQENFSSRDPAEFLGQQVSSAAFAEQRTEASEFSYSLSDDLVAPRESSEAMLSFMSTASFGVAYASALTLYVGIGGL